MDKRAIKKAALGGAILIALVFAVLIAFRIAYWNRILPGVKVGSTYVGGLSTTEANDLIAQDIAQAQKQTYTINSPSGGSPITVANKDLITSYNAEAAASYAQSIGRIGTPWHQVKEQIVSLVGVRAPIYIPNTLNPDTAASVATSAAMASNTPAENARFDASNNFQLLMEKPGNRVEPSKLLSLLKLRAGLMDTTSVNVPTYQIQPPLTTTTLATHGDFIKRVAQKPINLTGDGKTWQITSDQLLNWLVIDSNIKPIVPQPMLSYYQLPPQINGPQFNQKAIRDYVNGLSEVINQEPTDAKLSFNGTNVVVTKASANGRKLDATTTADTLITALEAGNAQAVPLVIAIQKPEIREDNLDSLGIKELVSEGVSYFPHSTAERMQNVRVGASKFQNAIVKPNSVFGFGDIMGYVGPETGYASSKVILGDHQEFQYGGGMCQVSSTAFRAALNGGYPILERTNHAFQVSYYTQPYGVPGVDATVYAPEVDFKFKNDTPYYILVQTEMVGTTLKFRYFSTKTKTGVIRGPYFVTGSLDANSPSQTVFYRDVIVGGQVAKTDTFNTYYKSALDFPTSN
jgi:vancomycin resistance protein YoaR